MDKFYKYTNKDIISLTEKSKQTIFIEHIILLINSSKNMVISNFFNKHKEENDVNEKKLFTSCFFSGESLSLFIITFLLIFKDGKDTRFNQTSMSPQIYKIMNNSLAYLEILEYKILKKHLNNVRENNEEEKEKIGRKIFEKYNIVFTNNKSFSNNILKGELVQFKSTSKTILIDFILSLNLLIILYSLTYNNITPYWNLFLQNTQLVGVWSTNSWIKRVSAFINPKSTSLFLSGFLNNTSYKYTDISPDFSNSINERLILFNTQAPDMFSSSLLEKISTELCSNVYLLEFNLDLNKKILNYLIKTVFEESITACSIIGNHFNYLSSLIILNIFNPKNKLLKSNNLIFNFNKIVYGNNQPNVNNLSNILTDTQLLVDENKGDYDNEIMYNFNYSAGDYDISKYKDIINNSSSGESSEHGSSSFDDSEGSVSDRYSESSDSEFEEIQSVHETNENIDTVKQDNKSDNLSNDEKSNNGEKSENDNNFNDDKSQPNSLENGSNDENLENNTEVTLSDIENI